ncbi:MAG: hypothetical protein GY859_13160 [Desulfobacterales bacterium]|nr:hypothetical protein [Desulfobacterales bacterium]
MKSEFFPRYAAGSTIIFDKALLARPFIAILLAGAVGAFSPFCSRGVIPVAPALLIKHKGQEKKWFEFVNRASNRVILHFGNHLMDNLAGVDVFNIFHTIFSICKTRYPCYAGLSVFDASKVRREQGLMKGK